MKYPNTIAQLKRQDWRYYTQRAHKAVGEYIRTSNAGAPGSFGQMHERLVAAYKAGDARAVASLLTSSREVDDVFEGGGGYNLMIANATRYVETYWQRIGRLLAKASTRPRARRAERRYNPAAGYVLFIGRREKDTFTSLEKAKKAAREDAPHQLKWDHYINNPDTPQEEEWYSSDDRQDILVRR